MSKGDWCKLCRTYDHPFGRFDQCSAMKETQERAFASDGDKALPPETVRKPSGTKGVAAATVASGIGLMMKGAAMVSAVVAPDINAILAREAHQRELRRLKQQRYRAKQRSKT